MDPEDPMPRPSSGNRHESRGLRPGPRDFDSRSMLVKNPDVFTCGLCKGVFPKGWTDEEAENEYQEKFGESAPTGDDRALICEDCYLVIEDRINEIAAANKVQ